MDNTSVSPTVKDRGDYIETFSGLSFYPLDPRSDDVAIEDIAHALSNLCRFGGHCHSFYSVAQHSVMVSMQAEALKELNAERYKNIALHALLHDAAEAYLVDVPRPIKGMLKEYKAIEAGIQKVILETFCGDAKVPAAIEVFDSVALATEARDLMPTRGANWQTLIYPPLPEQLIFLNPKSAKDSFLRRFNQLTQIS